MYAKAGAVSYVVALAILLVGISAPASATVLDVSSITVDEATVSLGGSTDVTLCAGDTALTVTSIFMASPTGLDTFSNELPAIDANTCHTWDVPEDFDQPSAATLNEVGPWVVVVDTAEGVDFFIDFAVTFFVVPESPIGVAALVGAGLAAFGGFMFWNKRSKRSTDSPTGLGI